MRHPAVVVSALLVLAGAGASVAGSAPGDSGESAGTAETGTGLPDDGTLEAAGATIGEVEIAIGDIFDLSNPAENTRIYRWANRLHRATRDRVIREQLLFHAGDPYSRRLLDESERILRGDGYLFEPHIRPVRVHDNQVDVVVEVRDVWTLRGGVSYGRKGGADSTNVTVRDTNFLGTGKDITLQYGTTVDRTGSLLRYRDPNLHGSRATLEALYGHNDDGDLWGLSAGRPFFSLDTRWAAFGSSYHEERIDKRYARGEIIDRYRHLQDAYEVWGGLSRGLHDGRAGRWSFGATYARDRFEPSLDSQPDVELPESRTLVYPWIGFEHLEDAYVEEENLDKIRRVEDRNLGLHYLAKLGFSAPVFGGDRSRVILASEVGKAWDVGAGSLVQVAGHGSGWWSGDGLENAVAGGSVRFYRHSGGGHRFFARLDLDAGSNLDIDQRLLLGGDNGLRGYPLRYQEGDRRFLLTLEERFFTNWYPLHLFNIGAAVFLDVGRAWLTGEHSSNDVPGGGLLKDVGVGLRLGNTRSGRGSVIHIDLAFPLGAEDAIDSFQVLVASKETF